MPLTAPLISSSIMEIFPFKGYNNHQLGLEQVCRKVSPVSGVWVKQALVRQGTDREQEDSHAEEPDHTASSVVPDTRSQPRPMAPSSNRPYSSLLE